MRRDRGVLLVMVLALVSVGAACGDGEDRPGMVTKEGGSGTGTGSASGSGTHSGSGSASATAAPAFKEADANTVVDVEFADHRFSGIPETVKGPKVFFKAKNSGPSDHELVVVASDGRHLGELHELKQGKAGVLAIELPPGTYTAQCLVKADDKTHAQLGMETSFTVQ